MRFLGFRLYAPLASFGDVAVGERRPSLAAPTRSMILGLIAGCSGVRREDSDGLAGLDRAIGVATRTDAPGTLLVDFHTAQSPDGPRRKGFSRRHNRPVSTRREETTATIDADGTLHPLETQLSYRQYRTDSLFAICLWLREEPSPWNLDLLAEHLRVPRFVPFAGRKSAALALPFEPTFLEAANPVEALRKVTFSLDGTLDRLTWRSMERVYRWEGADWPGLVPDRTEVRRDRVLSRARWQFLTRDEHVLTETRIKEAHDVPEPD